MVSPLQREPSVCGIIGYAGHRDATPILVEGLRKLEYRGYDSAGVGVFTGARYSVVRAKGKLSELDASLKNTPLRGTSGIAHTRWATHGRPSVSNAHPHTAGSVSIVHNGIVENHTELRSALIADGHTFNSETDSELIAVLVHANMERGMDLAEALADAMKAIEGRYAVIAVSDRHPERLAVTRRGSPIALGCGDGEMFVASDVTALLEHSGEAIHLDDGSLADVTRAHFECRDERGREIRNPIRRRLQWSPVQAQKGGYRHFMLKEIHEQPEAIGETLAGRTRGERVAIDEELSGLPRPLREYRRVRLIACGTSFHAGMLGAFWLEKLARVPAQCELASEFRYRDPVLAKEELVVSISQSGETADTLAALELAREQGCDSLAICNVPESAISRMSDATLYTRAGPEIGVASTKAYTTQLGCLMLLALARAQDAGLDVSELVSELAHVPSLVHETLQYAPQLEIVGRSLARSSSGGMHFLGRGQNHSVALEGALKLKEITYVPAEGYAAGEMKHGPIALIEPEFPVVALVLHDANYKRMLSALAEVKTRGARVIAIGTRGDSELGDIADDLVLLPRASEPLQPILSVIPLQLLAYYAALYLGTDVDQPRNLAKSVTVE